MHEKIDIIRKLSPYALGRAMEIAHHSCFAFNIISFQEAS
jgi:hypothetical protein